MGSLTYDRLLEIHVIHKGNYDFHGDVGPQLEYQRKRHGFPKTLNLTKWAGGAATDLSGELDLGAIDQGYIAVGVELEKIKDASPQKGAQKLLAWVGDVQKRGKIRINVHGDGDGNLLMRDGKGKAPANWLDAPGEKIVQWLHANGLPIPSNEQLSPRLGGLSTLALALCKGAHGSTPASQPASAGHAEAGVKSVVSRCIFSLREYGYFGIEVTASNETVQSDKGQIGRTIVIPKSWKLAVGGPGDKVLEIPKELKVNAEKHAIEIPEHYEVLEQDQQDWGHGWLVRSGKDELCFIPETGWYVEPAPRGGGIIQLPLGWRAVAGDGGGGTIAFKLQDPAHHTYVFGRNKLWFRLAHTPEKSRDIS